MLSDAKDKFPHALDKENYQPKPSEVHGLVNANDKNLPDAIQKTLQAKKPILPSGKKSLALTVGNGHFLSLTRLIPCDAFIHCDIAKDVIPAINIMRAAFLEAKNKEEFEKKLPDNLRKSYESTRNLVLDEYCFAEENTPGLFQSTSEQKQLTRMAKCQKSLQKPFSAVSINLFDEKQVAELGAELKKQNYMLTYINFSNVIDWDNGLKLLENLSLLPLAENAHFIISTFNPFLNQILREDHEFTRGLSSLPILMSFPEVRSTITLCRLAHKCARSEEEGNAIVKQGITYVDDKNHSILYLLAEKLDFDTFKIAAANGATFSNTEGFDDIVAQVKLKAKGQAREEQERSQLLLNFITENKATLVIKPSNPSCSIM